MIKQMTTSIVLVTLGLFTAPVGALTVFIDLNGDMLYDSQGTYVPGDIFTASIYADVDNAHGGLVGFGVSMTFDEPPISVNAVPTQLSNIIVDPQWNFLPTKSVGAGVLTAAGSSFMSFVGPSVHLFDATFVATANGISVLTMTDEIPSFGDFAGLDGFDYDASGELNFLITEVKVVPVPAAVWLFGSGLIGLIGVARRKEV